MKLALRLFNGTVCAAIATAIALVLVPAALFCVSLVLVLTASALGSWALSIVTTLFFGFAVVFLCIPQRECSAEEADREPSLTVPTECGPVTELVFGDLGVFRGTKAGSRFTRVNAGADVREAA